MNNINLNVYTDISIIISMMPSEMRSKINKNFISFIENNKDINYNSNINPNMPLSKQNISKETKEMLGIIYRDYLCDKEKRTELLQQEKNELTLYNEQQRELYNTNTIFKNRGKNNDFETHENYTNTTLIVYKESFIERLKNFIFKILHIKN